MITNSHNYWNINIKLRGIDNFNDLKQLKFIKYIK